MMTKVSYQTHKSLDQITDEEWMAIWKRLRLYAIHNYGWTQSTVGVGLDLEAIVQEAILDTLTGVRCWPPVDKQGTPKDVNLFFFLCQTVRSKVSHATEREKRKLPIDSLDPRSPVLIDSENKQEQKVHYDQLRESIMAEARSDSGLTETARLMTETPDITAKDIAKERNVPIKTVRKDIERLKRRLRNSRMAWIWIDSIE
jgi:DNA-directed RNA polymerase specialized sigma24 family protein